MRNITTSGKGVYANVEYCMAPSFWAHGRTVFLDGLVVGWGHVTVFGQ